MQKNIVLFGGGTTSSQILKGLKQFPVEITAVIGVHDSGRSTGLLREEFDIPAVGDLTKVTLSIADCDDDISDLMNFKFPEYSSIGANSIKNLIFTALIEQKGSIDKALPVFSKLINSKGNILPLTEENVNLIATTIDGEMIFGEEKITDAMKTIKSIKYDKEFKVNAKVFKAIEKADLIVISAGSLYTSIIPHLMVKEVAEAIKTANAPVIYVNNLVTQPGETEKLSVSEHVKLISSYIGEDTLDAVIVNSGKISSHLSEKYETREQKLPVVYDKKELDKMQIKVIADKLYVIEDNMIRHNSIKTAYHIFSYLINGEK